MTDHLVVLHLRPGPETQGVLAALAADLVRCGWRRGHVGETLDIWSLGAWPVDIRVTPDGDGVLIGEVFTATTSQTAPAAPAALQRVRRVLNELWGGYVAVWPRGPDGVEVLRDPSGAREALVWRAPPLLLVASRLSAPGLERWLPAITLDRDQVARFVLDASETAGPLALMGVEAVTPGAVWRERGGETLVWSPADLARTPLELPRDAAAAELRNGLEGVACAWAGLARPVMTEISGGLDSALVAAALPASTLVRRWITFFAPVSEGDERVYARAVAARRDAVLEERLKPAPTWDEAALAEISGAARPSLSAMDVGYDRAIAAEATSLAVWGVMTGQGGDAVFLNLRSPLIVDRIVRRRGFGAVVDPEVRATAAWCGTNVWSVLSMCRRARRGPPQRRLTFGAAPALRDLEGAGARHPWLRDMDGVSSVKRLQIAGCAQSLMMCAESRRSRAARQVHVPLQQPLMELGLRLPAELLVFGGRDRALARDAFRDRLPAEVFTRRGKGDLTATFGRGLASALPFVRERLLGGELRALGLVDLPALEARLDVKALAWKGGYGEILDLLGVETWVADWRSRIRG